MAGHEWDDWFEREEFIGQISDIRVHNLQAEREGIQKRTFTRWMNLHLEKCNPPMEISDLFNEIRDGRILMALLEELSGCKLLHRFKPSSHRIFRLNNIAKVLNFLEERNVKLISIDAADVADGNSSPILGLIWNIILFFQIKELTGNIQSRFSSTTSLSSLPNSTDSDTSHPGTPSEESQPPPPRRDHGKAIRRLLQWVQRRTSKYGVAIQDFGKSWTSGLAFLAVIKSIDSSLVDMRKAQLRKPRENIEEAFKIAHYSLGIPRLLEPEDVMISSPDEQSIITYVSQFLEHFPGHDREEVSEATQRRIAFRTGTRHNHAPLNGWHRDNNKPYIERKKPNQKPPKIFVSSVCDEVDSPCAEDISTNAKYSKEDGSNESPERPPDLKKELSMSPQLSCGDSAIGSPDSWSEMTNETSILDSPGLLTESPSPSSPEKQLETSMNETYGMSGNQEFGEERIFKELFVENDNSSVVQGTCEKSELSLEEEDAYRYILNLSEDKNDSVFLSISSDQQDQIQNGLQATETCPAQENESSDPLTPELLDELKTMEVPPKIEERLFGFSLEQDKTCVGSVSCCMLDRSQQFYNGAENDKIVHETLDDSESKVPECTLQPSYDHKITLHGKCGEHSRADNAFGTYSENQECLNSYTEVFDLLKESDQTRSNPDLANTVSENDPVNCLIKDRVNSDIAENNDQERNYANIQPVCDSPLENMDCRESLMFKWNKNFALAENKEKTIDDTLTDLNQVSSAENVRYNLVGCVEPSGVVFGLEDPSPSGEEAWSSNSSIPSGLNHNPERNITFSSQTKTVAIHTYNTLPGTNGQLESRFPPENGDCSAGSEVQVPGNQRPGVLHRPLKFNCSVGWQEEEKVVSRSCGLNRQRDKVYKKADVISSRPGCGAVPAAAPSTGNWREELHLLLLLWTLVYCLLILPQMDAQALMRGLFNLDE